MLEIPVFLVKQTKCFTLATDTGVRDPAAAPGRWREVPNRRLYLKLAESRAAF